MRHTRSMFVPHARVQEDGAIVNPFTGEVSYPPSMTKQEFAAETDINNIIKAFQPHTMQALMQAYSTAGRFEDLPDELDLQSALNVVEQAETAFMALPSKVRDRFHNEPGQFLAFMADPANEKEARELGLLNARPEVPPAPPPPAPEPEAS